MTQVKIWAGAWSHGSKGHCRVKRPDFFRCSRMGSQDGNHLVHSENLIWEEIIESPTDRQKKGWVVNRPVAMNSSKRRSPLAGLLKPSRFINSTRVMTVSAILVLNKFARGVLGRVRAMVVSLDDADLRGLVRCLQIQIVPAKAPERNPDGTFLTNRGGMGDGLEAQRTSILGLQDVVLAQRTAGRLTPAPASGTGAGHPEPGALREACGRLYYFRTWHLLSRIPFVIAPLV